MVNIMNKKLWQHIIVDLEISLTEIAIALKITPQSVWRGIYLNRSKRVQKYVLQKAIQKNIPIPKELSNII